MIYFWAAHGAVARAFTLSKRLPPRLMVGQMSIYRFRFFNEVGFLYETRHEHADDLDALDAAKLLSKNFSVEIWSDGRRVARVKPNDAPADVEDLQAG